MLGTISILDADHNERTNIQVVKKVINYTNKNSDEEITERLITYVEDKKSHYMRYSIGPKPIVQELGWHPETPFEIGVEKTINWYLQNEEWMNNITSGEYLNKEL